MIISQHTRAEGENEMKAINQQQTTWAGAKQVSTQTGAILIKKACEHSTCNHFRCERKDLKLDGIDI